MKDPYCPKCGVVEQVHSGLYCSRLASAEAELAKVRHNYKTLCVLAAKATITVSEHKPALLQFSEWQDIGAILRREFPAPKKEAQA